MQLFMAEYPDLKQNNFEFKAAAQPYNFYDPAFENTNDTNHA